MVLMVIVAATGAELGMEMEDGMEQVGEFEVAGKLFGAHVRFTVPVKEPSGVNVSVEVFPVVAPGADITTGVPLAEKGKSTGTCTVTVCGA